MGSEGRYYLRLTNKQKRRVMPEDKRPSNMRMSIVIAVLNSHEIVRRQILHWQGMDLPDSIEILLVDDGSDPPITVPEGCTLKNFHIHYTNDFRPWTQPIARNTGVSLCSGEYALCTDIDHIITKELIDASMRCTDDFMYFGRHVAILDENGEFSQKKADLIYWGYPEYRLDSRGTRIAAHGNSYLIRRELFIRCGGGRESRVTTYPSQEEVPLKSKIRKEARRGRASISKETPTLYMFPNGRYVGGIDSDPLKMFHGLSRIAYMNNHSRIARRNKIESVTNRSC